MFGRDCCPVARLEGTVPGRILQIQTKLWCAPEMALGCLRVNDQEVAIRQRVARLGCWSYKIGVKLAVLTSGYLNMLARRSFKGGELYSPSPVRRCITMSLLVDWHPYISSAHLW